MIKAYYNVTITIRAPNDANAGPPNLLMTFKKNIIYIFLTDTQGYQQRNAEKRKKRRRSYTRYERVGEREKKGGLSRYKIERKVEVGKVGRIQKIVCWWRGEGGCSE